MVWEPQRRRWPVPVPVLVLRVRGQAPGLVERLPHCFLISPGRAARSPWLRLQEA